MINNILRHIAKRPTIRDRRDDRRADHLRGPLVNMVEGDLAHLDRLTRALAGTRRN